MRSPQPPAPLAASHASVGLWTRLSPATAEEATTGMRLTASQRAAVRRALVSPISLIQVRGRRRPARTRPYLTSLRRATAIAGRAWWPGPTRYRQDQHRRVARAGVAARARGQRRRRACDGRKQRRSGPGGRAELAGHWLGTSTHRRDGRAGRWLCYRAAFATLSCNASPQCTEPGSSALCVPLHSRCMRALSCCWGSLRGARPTWCGLVGQLASTRRCCPTRSKPGCRCARRASLAELAPRWWARIRPFSPCEHFAGRPLMALAPNPHRPAAHSPVRARHLARPFVPCWVCPCCANRGAPVRPSLCLALTRTRGAPGARAWRCVGSACVSDDHAATRPQCGMGSLGEAGSQVSSGGR